MSKKQVFKELRKEFDRFPNLELAQSIELGKIGFYDNRKTRFQWRTNLERLGINTQPKTFTSPIPCIDEIYTTFDAVECNFSLGVNSLGNAEFEFSKNYSIATQANDMSVFGYEIQELESDILQAINTNNLDWDKKWVVVTQIFNAPCFSLLVSGSRGSKASLSTSVPIKTAGFNIADSNLGIVTNGSRKMAYQSVAKTNVTPFFRIYKLKNQWQDNWELRPYGRN